MSFEENKKHKLEFDDMNIKLHLNTSFDVEGIQVSEDLINRTLNAIRVQATETLHKENLAEKKEHKVLHWNRYVRSFASVAAAVLILFVGYNAVRMLGSEKQNNMSTKGSPSYDSQANMESEMTASKEKTDMDTADSGTADNAINFTAKADMSVADETDNSGASYQMETEQAEDGARVPQNAAEVKMAVEDNDLKIAVTEKGNEPLAIAGYEISFYEICPIPQEEAETVAITDRLEGASVMLSDSETIKRFYSVMNGHGFKETSGAISGSSYIIEISSRNASCTLNVGENMITSSYVGKDMQTEITYNVNDEQKLIEDLKGFISE